MNDYGDTKTLGLHPQTEVRNVLRRQKPVFSLQMTTILFASIIVALSLLVMDVLISNRAEEFTRTGIEEKATYIAHSVALSPIVIEGLSGQRNEGEIQTFANAMRLRTDVQFIVVFDMNAIRKSHPDINEVGKRFMGGDEGPVLQGQEHISIGKGTLGPSLRAFVPVFSKEGKQVGAVAVGILLNQVEVAVNEARSMTYVGLGVGLLVGVVGAIFLARKIKAIMFGLEPSEIAKLVQERSAMLLSVREGIVAVDQESRITLVNNEGLRLFTQAGIADPVGKLAEECIPHTRLKKVLTTGSTELNYELHLNGTDLLTNSVPIYVEGRIAGAIATFRDKTEIKKLADELSGVKIYADALRAQAHEFMNKMHVILGMIHMKYYDQLAEYINRLAQQQQMEWGNTVRHIKDPVLAGFILGKLSYAREMGAQLMLAEDCFVPESSNPDSIHDLITIVGNLVDNSLEAVSQTSDNTVHLKLYYQEENETLHIEVRDQGPGIDEELQKVMFKKGISTKGDNRGYGLSLVQKSVEHLKGQIRIDSKWGEGTTFIIDVNYPSTR